MDDRPWVVFAGRLVREKGLGDLVEAVEAFPARAGLLIVGDGPYRAQLESQMRGPIQDGRVRFVGALPHAEVRPYLHHADVVVLPSWYEERGRVVLEAMAEGTPVIATRTGGIPESLRDGVNGLLVPVHDPVRLAAAIGRILGDANLAASLGAAGRRRAVDQGIGELADITLAAYAKVAGSGSHTSAEAFETVGSRDR